MTRQAATEGMVLLENKNQTLPLNPKIKKLAVFGSLSYNFIAGGSGSVNKAYVVSLKEGLTNLGYSLDKKLDELYTPFVKAEIARDREARAVDPMLMVPLMPQPSLSHSEITESAKANDVALITIGRTIGESNDREVIDDFLLTKDERDMIDKVSAAFHALNKKVVVVLNVGGVMETTSWKDKVDAVLMIWFSEQEIGNSVADVLAGKANPSGKLSMTFPVKVEDVSSAANFQGLPKDKPTEVMYKEGIYIGYRYFDTFKVKPAYEFGYGLSYTTFEYSNLKLSDSQFGQELFVSVDVKNTG